ncbi:hypothetical protein [Fischerella thermalis]|nr:hypothetical protein [Fischerella thermalis]
MTEKESTALAHRYASTHPSTLTAIFKTDVASWCFYPYNQVQAWLHPTQA